MYWWLKRKSRAEGKNKFSRNEITRKIKLKRYHCCFYIYPTSGVKQIFNDRRSNSFPFRQTKQLHSKLLSMECLYQYNKNVTLIIFCQIVTVS